MADAILYSSFDQEGPGLDLGVTNTSIHGLIGMYNLLVPCLVTGYGSGDSAKPGQGWELIHADLPTGFKLKAPDGVFYIFMRGENNTYNFSTPVQIYLAEALSDLTAYPPTGTNVRSGHHADVSPHDKRHWICARNYYSYKTEGWWLAARGSQVLFNYTSESSRYTSTDGYGPTSDNGSSSYGGQLWFGNLSFFDPSIPKSGVQNHCILGGIVNDHGSYARANWNPSSENAVSQLGGGYTRLRTPTTGLVEVGPLPRLYGRVNMVSGRNTYKQAVEQFPPDLILERTYSFESSLGYTGYIPGQFYSTYYSHMRLSQTLPALGRSISLAETLTPIEIGGEPFYLWPTDYGTMFVSLLEKYWE